MKSNLTKYVVVFLIGMGLMFFLKQCNTEIVEVPVTVEVEVPVVEKEFDTIYEPQPIPYLVKEIDTALVEQYKKANDSLKEKLFEQAVEVKQYKEVFEDSIQTITVDAEVTGELNWLKTSYETKPRTIKVDTVIPVKVPRTDRFFMPYAEAGLPTNLEYPQVVLKAGADISLDGNLVFGASYDTQGRAWGKVGYRFNF